MKLVVGLGNPGGEYEGTRHNIGFDVAEALIGRAATTFCDKRFKGQLGRGRLGGETAIVLKPMTWMNLSGESVGPAAGFYKIPTEDIVVIHDDLDIELGRIKLKIGGGHGGHNGLRSLVKHLPDPGFVRVRVGIGRPPARWDPADYVLSRFTGDDQSLVDDAIAKAADAVEAILEEGPRAAMRIYNRSPKERKGADKAPETKEE